MCIVLSGPIEEVDINEEIVKVVQLEDLDWVQQIDTTADFTILVAKATKKLVEESLTEFTFTHWFFLQEYPYERSGIQKLFREGDIKLSVDIVDWPFEDEANNLHLYIQYEAATGNITHTAFLIRKMFRLYEYHRISFKKKKKIL